MKREIVSSLLAEGQLTTGLIAVMRSERTFHAFCLTTSLGKASVITSRIVWPLAQYYNRDYNRACDEA